MLKRIAVIFLVAGGIQDVLAGESDERWRVPDSALAVIVREVDSTGGMAQASLWFLRSAGWQQMTALKRFGEIAAFSAPAHLTPFRFHEMGKTVLEELRALRSDEVQRAIDSAEAAAGGAPQHLPSVAVKEKNVVANYLLHHLAALHLAGQAASSVERRANLLESALAYEAKAQGFLVDAFSAGHMRVPMGGVLRWVHVANTEAAHNFYSSDGLYVVNSRGEVWQAFGDGVTQWYAPTWEHVFEACCVSLRELFFVYAYRADLLHVPVALSKALGKPGPASVSWLAIQPGDYYYVQAKMPTLMLVPFPVSATWSVRTQEKDGHGLRIRRQYPQIGDGVTEAGFYDTTLTGPATELLYSWDALPPWMLPDAWLPLQYVGDRRIRDLSAEEKRTVDSFLVKSDTVVTSVPYYQELDYPPSYAGIITSWGGGSLLVSGSPSGMVAASVGYSPHWGFLPEYLGKFHVSGALELQGSVNRSERMLMSGKVGFTLPLSVFGLGPESPLGKIHGIRLEMGHTEGMKALAHYRGPVLCAGLETAAIPLGFTYAGVLFRPRLEVHYLQERVWSLAVELVII